MPDRPRLPTDALAIAGVAICCALPAITVVVAGAIASGWGAVLRLWPLSVAGVLLLSLGGVAILRRNRGRTSNPVGREVTSR